MGMTLPEFLAECLDEIEAVAQAAASDEGRQSDKLADWRVSGDAVVRARDDSDFVAMRSDDDQGLDPAIATHIARHDPARVLAEVAAKRRILAQSAAVLDSWDALHGGDPEQAMWPDVNRRERSHAWQILGALAQPYADRPGWDEGWRLA